MSIKCNHLSKTFNDLYAINDFSIDLDDNLIYGLIGRNGAGKTTLLKMLAKQIFPTNGDILINNKDLQSEELKEKICLTRETINIKTIRQLRVKDILYTASLIYPNWSNELKKNLIRDFELNTKKTYEKLSKGMQTMVSIIIGLSSRAEITLFDEPYIGLDPVGREIFYRYLREDYIKYPRTIIISTHLMNELQNMFEKVIFIHKGKLMLYKNMEEVQDTSYILQGNEEDIRDVIENKKVIHTEKIGRLISAYVMDRIEDYEIENIKKKDITISGMDLQTLFINLTLGENGGDKYE
ncbi:MAG: ABC transporter ATP-binding protein [Vallitalea sp.]|jgi:ABC-2 type transport system ATP-binding protein|nr:ABC transporter ATP-binding protein [Vallitalea sp.]